MTFIKTRRAFFIATILTAIARIAFAAVPPERQPLLVAVTERDIEAIVLAVGGNQVETFSLFKGCILRENLTVESGVRNRLAKTSVVVWTGFLGESAAITAELDNQRPTSTGQTKALRWIDVSKAAVRTNIPTSNCYGYIDLKSMSGDP